MDPKIEEELLNVLNAEFNTSLKIDHDWLSNSLSLIGE